MALPHPEVAHPQVTRVPGCCGGRPIIRGTRFPVSSVVFYVLRQGMTSEELVLRIPPPDPRPGVRCPLSALPRRRCLPTAGRDIGRRR
ncbi:MAG: DUF433 domain-containing protein [Bacillota bacterium]